MKASKIQLYGSKENFNKLYIEKVVFKPKNHFFGLYLFNAKVVVPGFPQNGWFFEFKKSFFFVEFYLVLDRKDIQFILKYSVKSHVI